VQGAQALTQRGELAVGIGPSPGGGKLENRAAVRGEGERDVRVGQCRERKIVVDVGALGLLGAEELAAGGEVVEELAHLDAGSGGRTGGSDFEEFPAVDDDLGGLG